MWNIIWNFIKKVFKKIPIRVWIEIAIGLALAIALLVFANKYQSAKEQLAHLQNNNSAYQQQLEGAQNNLIQYQFTIEQLNYFNDSVSNKLKQSIKESEIKDKKIKELQYMLAHYEYVDTIRLTDTIFCEPEFIFDTTIGDKWMNADVHLEYPSTIGLKQNVTTERTVIIHAEKETIEPPSKCFLIRLFQKKHTVVRVQIDESNPNLKYQQNTFIQTFEN